MADSIKKFTPAARMTGVPLPPVTRMKAERDIAKPPKSPKSPAAKSGKSAKAAKSAAADKIPKVKKDKAVADHPSYLEMVTEAINSLKDRKGASHQAILKHISAHYNLSNGGAKSDKKVRTHLATALKKGVTSGTLLQATGNGANGRFKVIKTTAKPKGTSTPKAAEAVAAVATVVSPSEKKTKSPKKAASKPSAKKSKKAPAKASANSNAAEAEAV